MMGMVLGFILRMRLHPDALFFQKSHYTKLFHCQLISQFFLYDSLPRIPQNKKRKNHLRKKQ